MFLKFVNVASRMKPSVGLSGSNFFASDSSLSRSGGFIWVSGARDYSSARACCLMNGGGSAFPIMSASVSFPSFASNL